METEIQNIINSIKKRDIRTNEEIKEINYNAVIEAYKPYLKFSQNRENLAETLKKLDEYEFIDYEHLRHGDYIRYIDKKYFFNMKLHNGGKVVKLKDDKLLMITIQRQFEWITYDNYIFKKLSEEDNAKMKLIELIGDNL